MRRGLWGYVFISPWILVYAAFGLYPLLLSFYLTFFTYSFVRPEDYVFVGIGNWIQGMLDPLFWRSVVNILYNQVIFIALTNILGLGTAILLYKVVNFGRLFRTIYFMPVVISIVVVSLLWRFIYDGHDGLLNTILGYLSFGAFKPVDWLGRPDTALGAIIGVSIWQAVGFHMVIWLSGLQTIPASLYEASEIDGATTLQKFRHITWPGLRNTAVLVLIVITIQAFSVFAQINLMTRGGPLDATQTLVFQVVVRGYEKQDIAGGSAISVLMFLFVLSISLVQRYLTRARVE